MNADFIADICKSLSEIERNIAPELFANYENNYSVRQFFIDFRQFADFLNDKEYAHLVNCMHQFIETYYGYLIMQFTYLQEYHYAHSLPSRLLFAAFIAISLFEDYKIARQQWNYIRAISLNNEMINDLAENFPKEFYQSIVDDTLNFWRILNFETPWDHYVNPAKAFK